MQDTELSFSVGNGGDSNWYFWKYC